ncbi:threonine synthase [Sphingobacterium spiritivorum]|uniref:Threonine synthase n=1 Tax=Sphingobacterium spiritivorum ATCC 33861 TaxID=525373 RepID=D7VNG2_SPHSI|nr:threonine synthase [Sphingobacterium spiritivorum]EFK57459.1 threonine synthase [Sphingobacterium spiritivorum ATCC 33861]QQT36472.1 threonine synthase [Sphingobacterium spiritivorum]WQD33223.1 threonine synthase [Sphingobacterium spiritivorum]SUJ20321.1 Threonine synthase [Sphingobacterium spiritivorum]
MKLYSTQNKDLRVSFKDAVFNSLPADKGLYMPEVIPQLDPMFIRNIQQYSLEEIAFTVAHALIGQDIPADDLKKIIKDAINFDAPVRFLSKDTAVLELFHGPSYAFKDFGARFMSRVMGYFSQSDDKLLDVLVATSGDTGGAVALGFLGVEGTRVTILYPKGKVSEVQEQQLTTNGQNIRALEVDGTFDDCQALVKKAFNDAELNRELRLTSANSINIARLIPQTFYYFYAYAQLKAQGINQVVFSVPSGNFGNIGAGLLAFKMGLPVEKFVAATNVNDTVPRFLSSGQYQPKPSVQTLANAMDVGDPSNWVRILDLFDQDLEALKKVVTSYTYDDEATKAAMKQLYLEYQYVACPHTAIAWLASQAYLGEHPGQYASVFLSTAHPCKFPDAIDADVFEKVKLPEGAETLSGKEKLAKELPVDYDLFKAYLLENN